MHLIRPFPYFIGCICFPSAWRWNSCSHRTGEHQLPCLLLVFVFKNKVGSQWAWFTSNQTSEMRRFLLSLRCSGTAHPIHLSAGNTAPPPISDWSDSSFRLLLKGIFWKPGPAALVPPSDMQQLYARGVLSTLPRGKLWIHLSRSAGSSHHLAMLWDQRWRLRSDRGFGVTSGQSHIDLRFIRSMVSAAAWGGSTRECQRAISRSRHFLQAEKHLGVIVRKHGGGTMF